MTRFERWAAWSFRHRWRVLAAWVAVVATVLGLSSVVGDAYRNDFALPGTESQAAADALAERAPAQAGDTVTIVFDGSGPRVGALLEEVGALPHVAGVSELQRSGSIGFATVALDGVAADVPREAVERIVDTALAAGGDGLRVEVGGEIVREVQEGGGGGAEGAGMLAALIILVLLFGSLLAASLPLVTAIFAVSTTIGLIVLASHVATFADFTPPLMMLVGLGVGIDYALLIFSRYRSELVAGGGSERAVRVALDTAGRSVLFAGGTVMFALLGLYVLGIATLQGMALAVGLTVLMTLLASLTLLPALLGVLGGRLERRVHRRAKPNEGARWRQWSAFVQRRPWPALVVALAVLLGLSAPLLGMRLGFADAGSDDPSKTSRQAYDLLAAGFGPGFSGPFVVVASGDDGSLAGVLERTEGVAAVAPGDATVIAFPDSKPQDPETGELLARLRDDVLPGQAAQTGGEYLVGGPTAAAADFTAKVNARVPLFLAVVVGLSALLLLAVFRSLLIPLKAAVLNLLTISASLGVITLVFGDSGPIEAFVPVMIFAIVFGLSMDYEVFLVSRMHEEWEASRDASRAIEVGLATTGRVITAAGTIMIVVFGAFVLSPERMLQQFGLGLAVAILLDAFLIRCLIVPAVMQLLGPRAWWLPSWLGRRLPRLALEPSR